MVSKSEIVFKTQSCRAVLQSVWVKGKQCNHKMLKRIAVCRLFQSTKSAIW